MKIIPVILSGGSGERLWPLSRNNYPKQFLNLIDQGSLFQQAALRLRHHSDQLIVVTGDDHRFLVRQQLHEIGAAEADVIIEPEGKNTAPAILAAACHASHTDPDAVMLVMPSDHYIPDAELFSAMITEAAALLTSDKNKEQIICFGIKPSHPETGYGYIKVASRAEPVMPVLEFTEKPDLATAKELLLNDHYLWNAGIFMMRAGDMLTLAEAIQPDMMQAVAQSYAKTQTDMGFLRLDPKTWDDVPAESFDYAFMEQAKDIGCVAFSGSWSDLGDWNALARESQTDAFGNTIQGQVVQIDSANNTLWAADENHVISAIGLSNMLVVAMRDAVLVADKNHATEIKKMVALMKDQNIRQASERGLEYRHWGWFRTIHLAENVHIKILHVNPKSRLSLQSHKYRSEHWVVISGTADVIRNDEHHVLSSNQSIYIAAGDKHMLINDIAEELLSIEVQTGTYFGEDDIIRYPDNADKP